ncbi:sensor histidine kinase [Rhodococcus rhodochrous]|uniref:sensor histidine kinase n=1 Tax=Rhodococcus rhodochrous TaxID=1829 RepID=UPI00132E7CE9|nr:histidine kinase [Rhodococcus rhodochrous]QHG81833.1 histidine kinase [Rhodococcus rhodochrous]QOH58490.1 histidine kinase [Rhodococcus rhodochrous]
MIDHLRRSLGTSVRAVVGLLLGIVTAVIGAAASTRRTTDGPGRAAERDRTRLVRWFDAEAVRDLPDREPTGYFLVRLAYGPLVGLVVLLVLLIATGYGGWAVVLLAGGRISVADGLVSLLVAAVMIYLSVRMAMIVGQWDVRTALRLLGDDATQHRLRDLQRTRADVVTAIDDERRRIERALHDDVQQRAVALALDVGRARRTAERGGGNLVADLDNAVAQAQALLTELRDVAWRIYPAALDEHGLAAALEGLSAHTFLPVDLDQSIDPEPPHDVAAAAYYVAAEGVTNATKHSGADSVSVTVAADDRVVTVTVVDDGCGGAEMTGSGLTGLARRVAALDGQFSVHSPRGGPTVVEARIPCAS